MNKKFTLENYYKESINRIPHTFDENLWNKLDEQLVPVRNAYNKKEKRRVFILWSCLLLIGGTTAVFFGVRNGEKSIQQFAIVSNNNKVVVTNKPTTTTANDTKFNGIVSFEPIENNFKGNISYTNSVDFIKESNSNENKNLNPSKAALKRSTTKKSSVENNDNLLNKNEINLINSNKEVIENAIAKKDIIKEDNNIDENKVEENKVENKNTDKAEPIVNQKKEEKKKAISKPTEIYALAGINSATPIKKSGYFAGVMLEKQIEDKRIFLGLKISKRSLNHEFISANKANIFPQVTDAVIEKVTTIQMPFGYQFKMNKKAGNKSTMLNLGFEPTLLTGVSTIYYDDNGIVGGPRTAVRNSPLLKNAVNKFNVSFIAGIKVPVSNKLFFSVNAGYGLINITDKQYYNRSIKNNNLKYIQAGFLLKLK
jgi:hypothetical protein